MKIILRASCLAAATVTLGLGGCAQLAFSHGTVESHASSELEATPALSSHHAGADTIKSGAAVSFRHTRTGIGRRGTVEFVVSEGYDNGTLTLMASGDDDLSVFGAQANYEIDLADGTEHAWEVDFETARDGVFYVNVLAVAETEDGVIASRAYAARLQVGNAPAQKAGVENGDMTTTPSGETVIMMGAEEIIE